MPYRKNAFEPASRTSRKRFCVQFAMSTMSTKYKRVAQGFPGGPAVKTSSFLFRGTGFNPWSGTNILHVAQSGQELEMKQTKIMAQPTCNLALGLRGMPQP